MHDRHNASDDAECYKHDDISAYDTGAARCFKNYRHEHADKEARYRYDGGAYSN